MKEWRVTRLLKPQFVATHLFIEVGTGALRRSRAREVERGKRMFRCAD